MMKYIALIAILLVTGCASTTPAPSLKQYLLRADLPVQFEFQDTETKPVIVMGKITVAPYIDGLGLVLEKSDGQVHIARDHQWAEPLRLSLRYFMSSKIAEKLKQPVRPLSDKYSYQNINSPKTKKQAWKIDLRIDELHGTKNGDAKLVAYWAIVDLGKKSMLSEHSFSQVEPLAHDGYGALVAAETVLLSKLASSISATLGK